MAYVNPFNPYGLKPGDPASPGWRWSHNGSSLFPNAKYWKDRPDNPPGWKWTRDGMHLIPESFTDATPPPETPTDEAITIVGARPPPKKA